MIRQIVPWWILLTNVGSAMGAGRKADQFFRYYTLKALADEGVFEYLNEPRTFGQLLAHFGFVESDFTRELLDTLSTDKAGILTKKDGFFRANSSTFLPALYKSLQRGDERLRGFVLLAEDMTRNILPRLRDQPVEFAETFEQDGRYLLAKFDKLLGARLYTAMREASFRFLLPEERLGLENKTLLDVGCGTGREPTELWLKLGGHTRITAIDPVPGMLAMAHQNFDILLNELEPVHPPVTDANCPEFQVASATRLPFEDNSFDAACSFYMLHWTSDPRKAISEILRVLKPGGLYFGGQAFKPEANPYFDLVIRSNENVHGFFWREDFHRWFSDHGIEVDVATPAGLFRAHKRDQRFNADTFSA